MCGRYTLTTKIGQDIADRFGVSEAASLDPATLGRFNVCPTEQVAVVTGPEESRAVRSLRWGLVPPWARELGKGLQPINARAETAPSKQPFAKLMAEPGHRCLVLADGWYEWLKAEHKGRARIPFRYTVDAGALFAFPGLWDERRVAGERVGSVTLLTTRANAVAAPVHDRMPVVLAGPDEEAAWLGDEVDPAALAEVLVPLAAERTAVTPANPAVNKAGVEGPELLVPPAEEPEAQLTLGT
jgi:putative SOS response-associated peptidase YedK